MYADLRGVIEVLHTIRFFMGLPQLAAAVGPVTDQGQR